MGMKTDSEEDLKKRFKELVSDLNLDKTSADEAWNAYQRIGINYTLEVSFVINYYLFIILFYFHLTLKLFELKSIYFVLNVN